MRPFQRKKDISCRYKIAIVALTCSYYQVPLFRELSSNPRIDLTVYFCSEEQISGGDVRRMFNTEARWGEEEGLLQGYSYKFLKNYSPFGSYLKPYCGLINFGICREIGKSRPDLVILMGWNNPTWWMAALSCIFNKIPFCYMSDTNIQGEFDKNRTRRWVKKFLLGMVHFPVASGFLCSGNANKRFYRHFNVPSKKLISFAYSWGYRDLIALTPGLLSKKNQFRSELGIPDSDIVILFCGRFVKEKNLSLLIRAYGEINASHSKMILVGDGELGDELRESVSSNSSSTIQFHGFQNRRDISKYYALADYLILASARETWGLVVNEAMCFGLPILVSNQVGSADDLVIDGVNGFIFPHDDMEALKDTLVRAITLSESKRLQMGYKSKTTIEEWSNRDIAQPLLEFIDDRFHR